MSLSRSRRTSRSGGSAQGRGSRRTASWFLPQGLATASLKPRRPREVETPRRSGSRAYSKRLLRSPLAGVSPSSRRRRSACTSDLAVRPLSPKPKVIRLSAGHRASRTRTEAPAGVEVSIRRSKAPALGLEEVAPVPGTCAALDVLVEEAGAASGGFSQRSSWWWKRSEPSWPELVLVPLQLPLGKDLGQDPRASLRAGASDRTGREGVAPSIASRASGAPDPKRERTPRAGFRGRNAAAGPRPAPGRRAPSRPRRGRRWWAHRSDRCSRRTEPLRTAICCRRPPAAVSPRPSRRRRRRGCGAPESVSASQRARSQPKVVTPAARVRSQRRSHS